MQRTYELMFIVRPDMPEEEQDKLISSLENQVNNAGGTVKNVEKMGKRRLAYVVRKFQDGLYMLMILEGEGGMVKEVERRLRVTEPVIKFMTVRVDEEQKRLARSGETMRVYVPYGQEWYGYLMRRLAERPQNLSFFVKSLISKK